MGAGQIGGIATLLDIDFKNAAGFIGEITKPSEGQYIGYYLSHAMLFCVGAILETRVVITPAVCVYGERNKFEFRAGAHSFHEDTGVSRQVIHVCLHKGYNHSLRYEHCTPDNVALLILDKPYTFNAWEKGQEYTVNRVRYGSGAELDWDSRYSGTVCSYIGWGSRRNGYLIPLLIYTRTVRVTLLPSAQCIRVFNYDDKYLCLRQPMCKSSRYGRLCPSDLGAALVCSGYIAGMMTSRLIDRPCYAGWLDLAKYTKFITCGIDDARDIIGGGDFVADVDVSTVTDKATSPSLITIEDKGNGKQDHVDKTL